MTARGKKFSAKRKAYHLQTGHQGGYELHRYLLPRIPQSAPSPSGLGLTGQLRFRLEHKQKMNGHGGCRHPDYRWALRAAKDDRGRAGRHLQTPFIRRRMGASAQRWMVAQA
ncbi:MAG: hypothetical protein IIC02_10990 [Planctomycetes bacterium]|nr:hypothetical protein [Planctomycetota bacterium]